MYAQTSTSQNVSCHAWHLDPLPDFLTDHTLAGESDHDKLRDIVSRWVQWITNLWVWKSRAQFGLHYIADNGRIGVYLTAVTKQEADRARLASEMGVLLRAHRLCNGVPMPEKAVSCLVHQPTFLEQTNVEIRQKTLRSLWTLPDSTRSSDALKKQLSWLAEKELESPAVVFPWWGPGGPFLVPMESLISQPVPVRLSVYLEPTQLQQHEWTWLTVMAREAQSLSEQNLHQIGAGSAMRVKDPSSDLAGRLYMANLRRLSSAPFLVTAHCVAAEGRIDVARSVAGAVQALVQEPPFTEPDQEDNGLPSGASTLLIEPTPGAIPSSLTVQFPETTNEAPLARIPYLAGARGASTVFRLPVSIRGGVPGIRVRQRAPDFHPGPRLNLLPAGHIQLGEYQSGGISSIALDQLCKHALVTGFTGSGKTVTVLQLLHQLWCDHDIPFLVLESAKQEYRGLIGVHELGQQVRVYTLGNETCVPLRLNPFQLLPGVRVEAHLSKLQSCIEGAIPPVGPSSSVISEALLRVYEQHGWQLTDRCCNESRREFPTLAEFVAHVEAVISDRGYQGEVLSNIQAALVGRFRPLLLGSKGAMLNVRRSNPTAEELFSRPTVLEMNDLNIDDKALVVMFVLTLLREYREQTLTEASGLRHVTVVEEAHNVLENVGSNGTGEGATAADTRYKAVQAFCQMLTEIRSLGESLIIADQSPEKLAPDAIRNTNLQISHQLRDGDDRTAIARAMIMDEEQRDFVGKLTPGQAAIFHTGLEKASFVQFAPYYPPTANEASQSSGQYRGVGFRVALGDDEVYAHMQQFGSDNILHERQVGPFPSCKFCTLQCHFRDAVFPVTQSSELELKSRDWFDLVNGDHRRELGMTAEDMWNMAVELSIDGVQKAGLDTSLDACWCMFSHLWEQLMQQGRFKNQHLDDKAYNLFCGAYERCSVYVNTD